MKYEIGGRVKISGGWYEINATLPDDNQRIIEVSVMTKAGGLFVPVFFIEDYEPPKPKPFDWLKGWHITDINSEVNQYLTDTYGDPTERVYRGEKAEEFGLSGTDGVLYWMRVPKKWTSLAFCHLKGGDLWRKIPNRITPIKQ